MSNSAVKNIPIPQRLSNPIPHRQVICPLVLLAIVI
jgi:hypothetical protein